MDKSSHSTKFPRVFYLSSLRFFPFSLNKFYLHTNQFMKGKTWKIDIWEMRLRNFWVDEITVI